MVKKIHDVQQVVVIGLGYVGFPLTQLALEKGFSVSGIDIDVEKIRLISQNTHPLEKTVLNYSFPAFTKNDAVLSSADIIIVAVSTPVTETKLPNLTPLIAATRSIVSVLQKNSTTKPLVVIESTINPGVMDEVIKPLFDERNLIVGTDYFLAHCPERISPGDAWELKAIPRVVGAFTPEGVAKAKAFYESLLDASVLPMSCVKHAEASKILENSFRDINIAFINEIAKSFDVLGIDVLEVIQGASTKPFAFMPHYPGCGVGGHCIPVDPYYLIEKAKQSGFNHSFLKKAREINESMPSYTVDLLIDALNEQKRCLNGTVVGVLGLSYKPNIGDMRESPSIPVIKLLTKKGAKVLRFDPFFPEQSDVSSLEELQQLTSVFVLCTAHEQFSRLDVSSVSVLVDGRNFFKNHSFAGVYRGIGRGNML
jgi:nucleotide sugar dehydrogenase